MKYVVTIKLNDEIYEKHTIGIPKGLRSFLVTGDVWTRIYLDDEASGGRMDIYHIPTKNVAYIQEQFDIDGLVWEGLEKEDDNS